MKTILKPTLGQVRAWFQAAQADGWAGDLKEGRVKLTKQRFTVMACIREDEKEPYVSLWGPDGLAIRPRFPYRWEDVAAGVLICAECGNIGETVRLAFANRVCPDCRTRLRPVYERPGWDD